jgi:hypothetical protein
LQYGLVERQVLLVRSLWVYGALLKFGNFSVRMRSIVRQANFVWGSIHDVSARVEADETSTFAYRLRYFLKAGGPNLDTGE